VAADLASRTGAHLTLAHVRHLPSLALTTVPLQPYIDTLDGLEAEVRVEASSLLDGQGIDWRLVILEGSPGEEIGRLAAELKADLVIVGANRHSTMHNLVLGSTSAHLTAHSPAAVLIVRPYTATGQLPPDRGANQEREPAASSPAGNVQRRPVVLRGVPQGDVRS
jgi:nucleotide-binding universal stress UspA family protein